MGSLQLFKNRLPILVSNNYFKLRNISKYNYHSYTSSFYSYSNYSSSTTTCNTKTLKEIHSGKIKKIYNLEETTETTSKNNITINNVTSTSSTTTTTKTPTPTNLITNSKEIFKNLFLPRDYPNSVTPDYIHFHKWIFVQNCLGSAAYVLSTHALLSSVIGGTTIMSTLPFAAAISWVLKDGLGASALVWFASKYSTLFDYDIKKYKFRGDILHNFGVLLEMCTPFAPGYFLPMASVSNLSKGLAGLMYGSTRASLNKSFSLKENLGDITAKYQSQGMAAYLTGMGLGTGIGMLLSIPPLSMVSNLFAVFVLSVIHLFCGYRALKSVNFKTFNQQRTSIILKHWFSKNEILKPKVVNSMEQYV
eukprot:gene808-1004_t